jgi:DNA-binding NarL/FixJ family response regulator
MEIIAYLLGAIGVVAALLAWAYFHVRGKMRSSFAYTQAVSIFRAPGRISLKHLTPFKWNKAERAEQRVLAFRTLGFEPLGGFRLAGEASARLCVMQHPVTGQIGMVQERDSVGTWSDAAFFQTGSSHPIYASNALKKAHFFLSPGDPKIHLPDAAEAELVAAVQKAVPVGARAVRLTLDNAAQLIEEAYAVAVDARLLEPLADFEIRCLLKEQRSGGDAEELADSELQRIKEQIPVVIANELRRACRDQFLRAGSISARDWQQAKDQLFVVHDQTPLHELGKRTDDVAFCLPALKSRLAASAKNPGTPRGKFAELNAALPPWERYRKLGEVTRPVPADIYCAPEQHQST